MKQPNLDRLQRHGIDALPEDRLEIWTAAQNGRHNLNLCDGNGDPILTIYDLGGEQLASLSLEIAGALGRAPDITKTHLRQIRGLVDALLDSPVQQGQSPEDQEELSGGGDRLNAVERSTILLALEQCGGSRKRAANVLGISVRTPQRKLRDWGR